MTILKVFGLILSAEVAKNNMKLNSKIIKDTNNNQMKISENLMLKFWLNLRTNQQGRK